MRRNLNQFDLTLEGQSNLAQTEDLGTSRKQLWLLAETDPRLKVLETGGLG